MPVAGALKQIVVDSLICICITVVALWGLSAVNMVQVFVESNVVGAELHDQ